MLGHGRRGAALFVAILMAGGVIAAPAAAAIQQPGTSIVVGTNADATADDGACTLREAITAANDNAPSGAMSGECPGGSSTAADTITFAASVTTVVLASSLPAIQDDLVIDGGGDVTVSGNEGPNRPFTIDAGVDLGVRELRIASTALPTLGGAMIVNGTADLTDVQFYDTNTDSRGGALRVNAGATVTVTRGTFSIGGADLGGGGIYNAGTLTLTDVDGGGYVTGGDGAAILNDTGATMTMLRTSFNGSNNIAGNGGAYANAGTMTIANSTIAGNYAAGNGGAIYNTGTLTVINVTVTQNLAASGAGIYNGGSALLKNALIVNNPSDGTDDYVGSLTGGSVGNFVGTGPFQPSEILSNQYGRFGGRTNVVPLTNSAANPALDVGDAATCAAAPISGADQRGIARPAGACDVGAVELDKVAPTWTTRPSVSLRSGQSLVASSAVARVSWKATDGSGSGIRQYRFQASIDGLSYIDLDAEEWDARLSYHDVELDRNHTYRFRVRAQDNDGNWSTWEAAPTFLARLVQQTAGSIDYTKTWTSSSSSKFSSGSVRYAKSSGASATYRATGRAYAFITTKGPTRGKARIYVTGCSRPRST